MKRYSVVIITSFLMICAGCSSVKDNLNPEFKKLLAEKFEEVGDRYKYDKAKASEYVIKGSSLQQQERYAEAILKFQEALRYDSSAAIIYAIGKSYSELGELELAMEYAVKSVSKSIEGDSIFIPAIELITDISLKYFDIYKVDDAITAYMQIIASDKNPAVMKTRKFTLAHLYEFKDMKKAIQIYEELLAEGEEQEILARLAILYNKTNNNRKYVETLEKLYDYSPENNQISQSLLEAYLKNKNCSKALDFLNVLDSSLPSTELDQYYAIVGNWLLDDTTDSANAYIKKYLERIDNRFYLDWRIHFISAYLANKIQDTAAAEKFISHASKVSDSIPEVPLQEAIFLMQRKKDLQAIEVLEKYRINFANDYRFPFYISVAYTNLDSNNKALEASKQAMIIDSTKIEVLSQIGLIFDKLKYYDSCDYYYEAALRVDPEDPLINNNYAYSLSERGVELERAEKMSKISLEALPINASYLDTYGWIQYKLGNFKTAMEYIIKAIDSDGELSVDVYIHLGYIYKALGRLPEAVEAWKIALEKEPDNKTILEELNLLKN